MVLEYDPVVRDHDHNQGKKVEAVPYHSLAVRHFNENIQKAESAAADPIPRVAAKLGLTELVKAVIAAGLKTTLESAG